MSMVLGLNFSFRHRKSSLCFDGAKVLLFSLSHNTQKLVFSLYLLIGIMLPQLYRSYLTF